MTYYCKRCETEMETGPGYCWQCRAEDGPRVLLGCVIAWILFVMVLIILVNVGQS